jgi:predicted kinase
MVSLRCGKHVIVDDTNLAPKHEARLRELAEKHGADFQIIDFTHVSVDECIERDRGRSNCVGEKVIRDMYQQFLVPAHVA